MKKSHILFLAILITFPSLIFGQELITFPDIPGRTPSDTYSCRVREVCSDEWKDAFTLQTKSKPTEYHSNDGSNANGYFEGMANWSNSWITFEFPETTEVVVEISKIDGTPITKAKVRPVGAASDAVIKNGKAYVTFSSHSNINVDIDGQMEDVYTGMDYDGPPVHNISLFGNPIYEAPDRSDNMVLYLNPGDNIPSDTSTWNTIYFAPGIHRIGTPYIIEEGKTFYISGDALVHGTFRSVPGFGVANNWTVYGSGTISGEEVNHFNVGTTTDTSFNRTFHGASHSVSFEGFVVIDPANLTFNLVNANFENETKQNTYTNLKILGWRLNSDGINAFTNSVIKDCFLRCQDDVFYYGSKVKISNSVVMTDANGSVVLVKGGSKEANDSYIRDITVIYHRAAWHYWDSGRAISFRSQFLGETVENVEIKNILVEDPFPAFAPFFFTMEENVDNITTPNVYENVIIENVVQLSPRVIGRFDDSDDRRAPDNTMLGNDAFGKFSNITFKNCYYGGDLIGSFEDGNFITNEFVEDISFESDGTGPIEAIPYEGSINDLPHTINQPTSQTVNLSDTVELTATTTDTNAEYQWEYDLGNGFVAINNDTQFSGVNNDILTIANVTENNNNQLFRCIISSGECSYISDTATLIVDDVLSVNDQSLENNTFSVFPNPSQEFITIHSGIGTIGKEYNIYNLQGKLIVSGRVLSESTTITIDTLKTGMYIIVVDNSYSKFVKASI